MLKDFRVSSSNFDNRRSAAVGPAGLTSVLDVTILESSTVPSLSTEDLQCTVKCTTVTNIKILYLTDWQAGRSLTGIVNQGPDFVQIIWTLHSNCRNQLFDLQSGVINYHRWLRNSLCACTVKGSVHHTERIISITFSVALRHWTCTGLLPGTTYKEVHPTELR